MAAAMVIDRAENGTNSAASPSSGGGGGTQLTSVASILALLEESDYGLKAYALQQLSSDSVINGFWHEIADILPKVIEPLCEDEEFKERSLACIVASKVFYHLEELELALKYALGAGVLFDLNERTEYVTTLVCKCVPLRPYQNPHHLSWRASVLLYRLNE